MLTGQFLLASWGAGSVGDLLRAIMQPKWGWESTLSLGKVQRSRKF